MAAGQMDSLHPGLLRLEPKWMAFCKKPEGIAFPPDGGLFYVATSHGNSVVVADAKANRIEARIPTGKRPWGLAILPDGSKLYTANGGSGDVSIVDVTSWSSSMRTASRPSGVM